jgi:hypothetical protein
VLLIVTTPAMLQQQWGGLVMQVKHPSGAAMACRLVSDHGAIIAVAAIERMVLDHQQAIGRCMARE